MKGLIAQLEHLGDAQTPAAIAQRDRINEQFTIRFDEQAAARAELDALTASQPAAEDPSLLDELPYASALLPSAPPELRARIYAAFQVHALYRAKQHQATITATITAQTPQIIHALISDPRTDHDTANPARTNLAGAAIGSFFFVIMLSAAAEILAGPGRRRLWPFNLCSAARDQAAGARRAPRSTRDSSRLP